ncbi:MAG: tRNA pseudouridine(55) synthase TruB [candidate division Zixibacteria bacterium CG_4_9_14_3_um_filter_46_8]|nr:MAG: tRNA pseudouridine(55) synthase TruB [candidate division Zixibacteria bacterium CG_4_9_14_3_um_filter_46_8]
MTVPNSGFICVGKPPGWTSFDVVRFARERWNIKYVGHTGTLDPMAEGILILCLGEARKLSSNFLELPKSYMATIRFGCITDTDDITGSIIASSDLSALKKSDVYHAAESFMGDILQTPPKYSAVKIDGQRAYKKARKGKQFEIPPKKATIHEFNIRDVALPDVTAEIRCSSGTYIRSIARDWGESLGVGGTLSKLTRTSIGHLNLNDSHSIEQLRNLDRPPFLEIDYALSFISRLLVNDKMASLMRKGVALNQIDLDMLPGKGGGHGRSILMMNDGFPVALIKEPNGLETEYSYMRVFSEWK